MIHIGDAKLQTQTTKTVFKKKLTWQMKLCKIV